MNNTMNFYFSMRRRAEAAALIKGSEQYKEIRGIILFYSVTGGVIVQTELEGLPTVDKSCNGHIFAFHIHDGISCTGNDQDAFSNAGSHYNPYGCPHPYHAGDMPPLFDADGKAFSVFLSNRFTVSEIIGKTVILHLSPDDFSTQPSGNAGEKIACGVITQIVR